jgi:hypothetical protein
MTKGKDAAFREYRNFVLLVRTPLLLGLCLLVASGIFIMIFGRVAVITTALALVLMVVGAAGYVSRRRKGR